MGDSGTSTVLTRYDLIAKVVVCYLKTAMYYSYGHGPSTVCILYDGHMITEDECGPNLLTFVLRLRENPGKTVTRKLTRPENEPGTAG